MVPTVCSVFGLSIEKAKSIIQGDSILLPLLLDLFYKAHPEDQDYQKHRFRALAFCMIALYLVFTEPCKGDIGLVKFIPGLESRRSIMIVALAETLNSLFEVSKDEKHCFQR